MAVAGGVFSGAVVSAGESLMALLLSVRVALTYRCVNNPDTFIGCESKSHFSAFQDVQNMWNMLLRNQMNLHCQPEASEETTFPYLGKITMSLVQGFLDDSVRTDFVHRK